MKQKRDSKRENRIDTIKMILFIIDPPKGILIIRLSKAGQYERQLIISARPFVALHAYTIERYRSIGILLTPVETENTRAYEFSRVCGNMLPGHTSLVVREILRWIDITNQRVRMNDVIRKREPPFVLKTLLSLSLSFSLYIMTYTYLLNLMII